MTESNDIAIIGLAGRFPGARSVDQFWENLKNGVEGITYFTDAELLADGIPESVLRNPAYIKAGPFMDGADLFDADFFGISPREARTIDPQHRVFLECAYEALENAGYNTETYPGEVAVFGGAGMSGYWVRVLPDLGASDGGDDRVVMGDALQTIVGNDKDYLATRVAYKLNLRGPAVTVQTACSTSLVAVEFACEKLLSHQCDMALAGGVAVRNARREGYLYQDGMMYSPDGHTRTFDRRAQGTVFGSGCGIVVLKRLDDALEDGDTIHAVIKGIAINNDASQKIGYVAPGEDGQARAIASALAIADIDASTVSYVEAHGTATPIGDPIEVAALTRAFRSYTQETNYCAIGSVKSSVGHLDAAAGITGLIKTVLMLAHGKLVPSLHFEEPNPDLQLDDSPFYVSTELRDWSTKGAPKRACVSAFGIGGTNAHVVLEEGPARLETASASDAELVVLSARTQDALEASTARLKGHLEKKPQVSLADIAHTLRVGRREFAHRRIVVASDISALIGLLSKPEADPVKTAQAPDGLPGLACWLRAQSPATRAAVHGMCDAFPVFAEAFDECAATIQARAGIGVSDLRADVPAEQKLFDVAAAYAFAKLWLSVAVPSAIRGSGVGSLVARCLRGDVSIDAMVALVVAEEDREVDVPDVPVATNPDFFLDASGDKRRFLEEVGRFWLAGGRVNWDALDAGKSLRRCPLPTYPFERKRYWVDAPDPSSRATNMSPSMLGDRPEHPVLWKKIESPALSETLFVGQFGVAAQRYLIDHQVFGAVVVPGTAYLEMALSAARSVWGSDVRPVLEDVMNRAPLFIEGTDRCHVQLVWKPELSGVALFEIYARVDSTSEWKLQTTGRTRERPLEESSKRLSLDAILTRCSQTLVVDDAYKRAAELGLQYGPSFRAAEQIRRGPTESLTRIRTPAVISDELEQYAIHPALLDACLQAAPVALPDEVREGANKNVVYLPVGVEQLHLDELPRDALWCHCVLRPTKTASVETFVADIALLADSGEQVGAVRGLLLKRVTAEFLGERRRSAQWLHEINWKPEPLVLAEPAERSDSWLIVSESADLGQVVMSELEQAGVTGAVLTIGAQTPEDIAGQLRSHLDRGLTGVAYLATNASDVAVLEDVDACNRKCTIALEIAHALTASDLPARPSRLVLVTRAAHAVETVVDVPVNPAHTALWGFCRVARREHPELNARIVDLGAVSFPGEARRIADEIRCDSSEPEIAIRRDGRYVPRLQQHAVLGDPHPDGNYRLEVADPGALSSLAVVPCERREPGAHEVEVSVRAGGLNFKDVLFALGAIPNPFDGPVPLGSECAGVITKVGSDVTRFGVGDEVMAAAPYSFSRYLTTSESSLMRKPAHLSFEQAATIPVVFATAYFSLCEVAKLRKGERVLIHTASGGVGLAAVQVAQDIGAEIFATAGSDQKRAHLRSLGVEHVMDSRSLDFARQILEQTNGAGVHVALNTLAGDAVHKTLACLASAGRFVELGVLDVMTDEKFAHEARNKDIFYRQVNVGNLLNNDEPETDRLVEETVALVDQGRLRPPPCRSFAVTRAQDAFRFMAGANHIGKLALTFDARDESTSAPVCEDASYLISGGFGGLGLRVAQRLVQLGARSVALVGRHGPRDEEARNAIAAMEAQGAKILQKHIDVTDRAALELVIKELPEEMPLRGVVHAAAVLDDGLISKQTPERFARVTGPKVAGAWNLHEATKTTDLDFFVMFSSTSAILGAPSQSNYAAANAYMDGLAHARRCQGLPAVSINWGSWAEVGMAATHGPELARRMQSIGAGWIPVNEGVQLLDQLFAACHPQIVAANMDWSKYLAATGPSALLQDMSALKSDTHEVAVQASSEIRKQVAEAPAEERRAILISYVQDVVAQVLGADDSSSIDPTRSLFDLGLDSLMGLGLKSKIQSSFGLTLPLETFFETPTIAGLCQLIETQLAPHLEPSAQGPSSDDGPHSTAKERASGLRRRQQAFKRRRSAQNE